ncbi:sensor histidine kinase [Bifidobacterium oedipodis]|uniref:histidine kinase n=1 Tax=Bifidobacterium oedipodis TaxID=2675322 RepID=A0A7Y0ENY2_9BIFI|nr:HAMP domain-containing sensor histidine kinase [Bifidobacterium sp. DSM 109957]NMM93755.1 histidine kinase [Bifidobacterium sp. DSM 109957]
MIAKYAAWRDVLRGFGHLRSPISFRIRLATSVGALLLIMLLAVILVQNVSLDWAFQHQVDTVATGNVNHGFSSEDFDSAHVVPNYAEACDADQCDSETADNLIDHGEAETRGAVLTVRDGVVQWMRYGSLAVFVVAMLLAVLLVWRLSGALTMQLDSISRQAVQLDPDHPVTRIVLDHPDAETSKLASALNGMLDRIEQSNELQRSFIRNASHELKTPVTTIGASLEALMAQSRFTDDVKPAVQHAIKANRKSGELIASLLELSHIQTSPDASRESINLLEVIRKVMAAHVDQSSERHLNVDLSGLAGVDDMFFVETNTRYLTIAIDNLVRNAIVHNIDHGSISCSIREAGEQVAIVIDNTTATVVNSDDMDNLLQPFHRGDNSRMSSCPGHGLGLSIVAACANAIDATFAISRPAPDMFRASLTLNTSAR